MRGTEEIVEALRERQQRLDESDGQFARRLGVTRQAWQMTRTGVFRPGERILQGAARAFPELTPEIMALFLPRKASILTTDGKDTSGAGA